MRTRKKQVHFEQSDGLMEDLAALAAKAKAALGAGAATLADATPLGPKLAGAAAAGIRQVVEQSSVGMGATVVVDSAKALAARARAGAAAASALAARTRAGAEAMADTLADHTPLVPTALNKAKEIALNKAAVLYAAPRVIKGVAGMRTRAAATPAEAEEASGSAIREPQTRKAIYYAQREAQCREAQRGDWERRYLYHDEVRMGIKKNGERSWL